MSVVPPFPSDPPSPSVPPSAVPPSPAPSSRHAAVAAALRAAGCVFAEDEADLLIAAAPDPARLADLVGRRAAGQPLEHVVGWAEFCGLRVAVDPGVFVPRRRTELLAREAAALAGTGEAVMVDLCCGSGAVAAVLTAVLGPRAVIHAVDIDAAAVRCARRNVPGAVVHRGDLFTPLPTALRGRIDVLVANAPYVPSREIGLLPAEARDHEPLVALDGGPDGLDIQRRVAAGAARWLAPGGHVLVETSERQTAGTVALFESAGLRVRVATDDELDATVVTGTLPGAGEAR